MEIEKRVSAYNVFNVFGFFLSEAMGVLSSFVNFGFRTKKRPFSGLRTMIALWKVNYFIFSEIERASSGKSIFEVSCAFIVSWNPPSPPT
jgi:hypothetical protein